MYIDIWIKLVAIVDIFNCNFYYKKTVVPTYKTKLGLNVCENRKLITDLLKSMITFSFQF